MKNNKGFVGIGIILAIIAVLAVGGGAIYYAKKTPTLIKNSSIIHGKCGDYKEVKVASKGDIITGEVNAYNYNKTTGNIDMNTVGGIIIPNMEFTGPSYYIKGYVDKKDYDVIDSSNLLKSSFNIEGFNTITVKVKNDAYLSIPVGPFNPNNLQECTRVCATGSVGC